MKTSHKNHNIKQIQIQTSFEFECKRTHLNILKTGVKTKSYEQEKIVIFDLET
jgi:hypothetical protein